jgi:hypothetical protein
MAYIGVQPTDTYLSIASQQITGNGGATYTLDYSVSDEESVAVFVNNVRQNVSTYTVSGTSLTLGGTISASDSCWVLFLGRTVGTKTPANGSVTNDMLAGSIATSKLADGSTFATTNGITEADQWRLTTSFSGDASPIASNLERNDGTGFNYIGTGMTQSSGIFTFPRTGIWFVEFALMFYAGVSTSRVEGQIEVTTNNSTYSEVANTFAHGNTTGNDAFMTASCSSFVDVTDTSLVKVKFDVDQVDAGNEVQGTSTKNRTWFTFIRLGDT